MQEQVIASVLEGRDTLALLPTGGGKSLCFQVPAIAGGKLCLVISPLIALMRDQVARLRERSIPARAIISGMTQAEIENALDSALAGKLSFLYVSPERLGTDHFLGRLPRLPLGLIAVDEAHCISQWGYDFRPSYLKIHEIRMQRPEVPVIALTASATKRVAQDIMEKLSFSSPNVIRSGFQRKELVFWVSRGEDKQGRLLRILRNVPGTALVYLRDRKGTMRIAHFLKHHGLDAEAYHAGMAAEDRDRIQKAWTTGATRIVVATNAFGMGIDKPDVRTVIHMDLPPDLESYYQEAGRGGRDGDTAHAFLLIADGDRERALEKLEASFPPLTDVRRVYQAFADMNGIAIGSGSMENYPVDLRAIADRTGLPIGIVGSALKALELDGRIALSEGVRSPSRALITTTTDTIYRLRVGDPRLGPLLESLLRSYGGMFEEPSIIDEKQLARMNAWQVTTVIERLKELDRMKVISYRKSSDSPSITLLVPRADTQRLQLDPVALKDRKERATARQEAMIGYVESSTVCRSRSLLAYFDEPDPQDCGQCDVCRRNTANRQNDPIATIANTGSPEMDMMRWRMDEEADRGK